MPVMELASEVASEVGIWVEGGKWKGKEKNIDIHTWRTMWAREGADRQTGGRRETGDGKRVEASGAVCHNRVLGYVLLVLRDLGGVCL
jgi:hypothetical protein